MTDQKVVGSEPSGSDVHVNAPLGSKRQRRPLMLAGQDPTGTPMVGMMPDHEEPSVLLEKADKRVDYRMTAPNATETCGNCRFFDLDCSSCNLVEGTITTACVCDLWTAQLPGLVDTVDTSMGMSESFAVFVEAGAQAFADLTKPAWIPFLPKPGKYDHPVYGEVVITPEQNQQLVASVKSHVYQAHIPLDAEHQTKLSGAVAWIQDMRMNSDGSADAFVEWTDRGRQLISGGQFKYVSPEWFGEWTDPATGITHLNVVAGGAIVTRPFFKDKVLRALVASESGAQIIPRPSEPASYWFKDYSTEERQAMAKSGAALSDGSFPIANVTDLHNAIHDWGRAGSKAGDKAHIIKRARALGALAELPPDWGASKAASEGDRKMGDPTTEEKAGTGEGAPPTTTEPNKTFTAAEVDAKITDATQAFAERIAAAEALAATEKTAREAATASLAALVAKERHQRFTEVVAGKGGSGDGAPWAGDQSVHVLMLEGLADKFGEDNELFTKYVENQSAVAAQIKESNLFAEIGTGARSGGSEDPTAKLDAMTKAYQKDHADKTYAQAYSEVLSSPEGARIYASIPTKS